MDTSSFSNPISTPKQIEELVKRIRSNADSQENGRVKAMVITKLQEAMLLAEHINDKDF